MNKVITMECGKEVDNHQRSWCDKPTCPHMQKCMLKYIKEIADIFEDKSVNQT